MLESEVLIFHVGNGLVRELWSEMSDLQVVTQLGAFPVPEQDENGQTNSLDPN